MNENGIKIRAVQLSDQVAFHCTRCGACCRHNKNTVMLNILDIFRLAQYFGRKNSKMKLDDVLYLFAEVMPLDESGFPIYLLKTTGPDNACIFYKHGLCSVQEAKPYTCRLYPFTVEPTGNDTFAYYLCEEWPRHLTGGTVRVDDWMRENFSEEDREFQSKEYDYVRQIGLLLRKLAHPHDVLPQLLYFRYSGFDLDEPFLPQYISNNQLLIKGLKMILLKERDERK